MTDGHPASARRGALVDVILSLGVIALGIAAATVALSLPNAGGYSRVGPNVIPVVVSFGLARRLGWLSDPRPLEPATAPETKKN